MKKNISFILLVFFIIVLPNTSLIAQKAFVPPNRKVDMLALKKSHPRVLVGDFEPIRKRLKSDLQMQDWLKQLSSETTMDAIALRFQLTGDTNLIRAAVDSALSLDLAAKIKKGPHHYGKSICFLGCTYDWLHDYLSFQQRNQLLVMLQQGLEAYLQDPDKTNFHNMNHCLNAGAIVGAIAIADEAPALAKKVLEVAINTINLTWYQPDGVTPEGPHYMNWSSLIMISGLSSLDIAFNDGFGLSDDLGIMGYGDFMMHITIPKKGIAVKYSDCYTNGTYYNLGQFFWIANKFNRADISQFALENDAYTASGENPDYSGKIHQLLWYNPEKFKTNANRYASIPLDKQFKSAELAVMRSAWNDENAIFTALKGTDNYHQANFYHRHTNTGTFFLSALGQQWAVDLGLEDYAIPDYNEQPRRYYKLRAEGHNCNIINPGSGIDQLGWENCPIISQGSSNQESYAVVDMQPDYINLSKSAKRGLKLFDHRRKILLQDEINSLDGKPLDSYWFMHTEAGIEIAPDGRSAILYRANERLLVYMATAPKDARFTVMGTEPLVYTKPVKYKQDWTFGAKKLSIHTNTEKQLKLAIVFVPLHEGDAIQLQKLPYTNLDDWKINAKKEATLSSIKIEGKPIANFDERQFTYTIDGVQPSISQITAVFNEKNANISIEKNNNNSVSIKVAVPGYTSSNYLIYFREKPIQILRNSLHEYSSWDESFANHRIIAPKIKAGEFIEYELNQVATVGNISIGFTNQQLKSYPFEIWVSTDKSNWSLAYNGASKIIPGIKMPMPQSFALKTFQAKFIRIKNPIGGSNFTIDVLQFNKDEASAKNYSNNAYKEILSDIVFPEKNIQIKLGDKKKILFNGLSNYGKKILLEDAKLNFESENTGIMEVALNGEIVSKSVGETFVRVVVQKGDYVFHKKIAVTVTL